MNPLREKTEYALLCGLIRILRILPEPLMNGVFRLFGALFFLLSFRRRGMALKNLKIAFPEKRTGERLGIAWRAFQHMALSTGDSFLLLAGKLTPDAVLARVDGTDLEKYRRLAAGAQHGILFLTGHLGNWELLGNYGALCGFRSHVVARRGSNRLVDEKIVTPLRTRYGNQVFYKDNAMLHSVKALKRNEAVSFLIDQKIGEKEGVTVQFFGREILAVASCAVLQIRFNPLVIPVFMVRTGTRRYKLLVGDPVEWHSDAAPQAEQIRQLTQRHQQVIEAMIRRYPDQWFWMHNRFRLMDARTRRRNRRARRRAAQSPA